MKKIALCFLICALFSDDSALFREENTGEFNKKLISLREELKHVCQASSDDDEDTLKERVEKAKTLKSEIHSLEKQWKQERIEELKDEEAVFWDQGETTISDLVMEYGSSDFIYIIPPEVSSIKITLHSQIPLPYESWDEMISILLNLNGIGVKQVNPFCKQLFLLKRNIGVVDTVVRKKEDLELISDFSRVFFVFSPPPEKVKSSQLFFERFSDPVQTQIHAIGSKIGLVSTKETVVKLVDLYQAVLDEEQGRKMEVISLGKLSVAEGEKIINEFFQEDVGKGHATFFKSQAQSLKIIPLEHDSSLVLVGPHRMIDRAKSLLEELQLKLQDPGEMTTFWYTCKHTDPDEIAETLDQVYSSLIQVGFDDSTRNGEPKTSIDVSCKTDRCYKKDPPFTPINPVNPPKAEPGVYTPKSPGYYNNFIVDPKTGSILMVIRLDRLDQIKSIVEKLDVPRKMVQIDVLLVERRIQDRRKAGMNLLKIGSAASDTRQSAISFDTNKKAVNKGLLEFILSRPKTGSPPAFDLTYQFLLAQDDLQVNANPSVLAVNNTPATISVVDEISINNGAVPIDTPAGGVAVEQSYTRAQYGITIFLTPVIHRGENSQGFITMHTDITFDTTGKSFDDRPPVARRHIVNEVRIADGETIVLGGLRQKSLQTSREKVPFLGEIPGIGKLFGLTDQDEKSTEMIFFITPHIIKDPVEDLRCIRRDQVEKRAGDIPEFIQRLNFAKNQEKQTIFQKGIHYIWDKLED